MSAPAALPADARDRLVKICGLLASDHAGERAAAGLKASELLRSHGLTWPDLFAERRAEARRGEQPTASSPTWRDDLTLCRKHLDRLADRDADFIISISTRRSALSVKQMAWLADVAGRLRRGGMV